MLVSAFLRLSNDRFLAQRAAGLAEKLKSEPSGAVHLADWVEKKLGRSLMRNGYCSQRP